MNAIIINIGDELLIGQVVNSNAAVMARLLGEAGIEVSQTVVVGDNAEAIRSALDAGLAMADVVLLTGGLGPTKDDITKHLLAEYFGSPLVENEEALQNVRRLFAARGYELTEINRRQAWVPACCTMINNDMGTAPCMWFEREEKVVVAMPGVPFEMEWLMRERVVPRLHERAGGEAIVNKNILVEGIGESFLSDLIEPWELGLHRSLRLAYLPEAGLVKLRITARGGKVSDGRSATEVLQGIIDEALPGLYQLAGQHIVGEDAESLPQLAHQVLLSKGLTLATAESCTGGSIASRLAAQAGASAYLKGGVVAYSNAVKEAALGVAAELIERDGAVSETVAAAMAEGVRLRLGADVGVSTTGVAGPAGGSAEKPVGTVCFGISTRQGTAAHTMHFGSRRQQNIDRAVNHALAEIVRRVQQE